MSRMALDRKPPLPRSPVRLRPRRAPCDASAAQTPPGSLTKSQIPSRPNWVTEELETRSEYRTISSEFRALEKLVRNEFGNADPIGAGITCNNLNFSASNISVSLFERGRFYEEYSARRNERLKRKKGAEAGDERKSPYRLRVAVESSAKRRDSKKYESLRKSVPASAFLADRRENTPRYALRSSSTNKENKKPPLAVNFEKSTVRGDRRVAVRRVQRI
ncbi:uncharacterized protein LOC131162192 [Malania oleifera]|uniref:uncharacterized protein LOC131162192 n=1 Tax=Malania oleifera TaxID=397392 RepID=UPI0025ADDA1F|nr:uncharacterized protein LOC131162192 [Malania oleifera]